MSTPDSEELVNELSALNNELVNARRELVRTNERLTRSMEELKSRQEWITASINMLPDAVFATDTDFRVSYVNESAVSLIGLAREDFVGKDLREVIQFHDRSGASIDFELLVGEGAQTRVALRESSGLLLRRENGSSLPVAGTLTSIHDPSGREFGLILLLRDSSDSVRFYYESVGQSRKEAAETIAAALLHDLNNLLMVILANAEAARTQLSSNSEQVVRSLANIEHAGKRADEFVRNVLSATISSLDRRGDLDVGEVVRTSAHSFQSLNPEVTVQVEVAEPLPAIFGNDEALARGIGNLLDNAAESLNGSGTITVSARVVRGETDVTRVVEIEVRDDGPGMTPEVLERALEPFYSTKELGRGLGLPVALGIARGHGGTLSLASAVERGTSVTIGLPVVLVSGQEPSSEASADSASV